MEVFVKNDWVLVLLRPTSKTWRKAQFKAEFKHKYSVLIPGSKKVKHIPKTDPVRIRHKRHGGNFNPINKTLWPDNHEEILRNTYQRKTNAQLAKMMKVGLTVLRNELHRLSLIRYPVERWSEKQKDFIRNNFRVMGDQKLKEYLDEHLPRPCGRPWQRWGIRRFLLRNNLTRTPEEMQAILIANEPSRAVKLSAYNLALWRRVKRYEALGMKILFTKRRSKQISMPTKVIRQNSVKHLDFNF